MPNKITSELIRDKIYIIRGKKVMLDYDLAMIYGYDTKYLNRQVKRNIERFEGEDFMFQLTAEEFLRCQNGTSKVEGEITAMDQRLIEVEKKAEKAIMRDEISPILLDFNSFSEHQEYLLMNGELVKAKEIYQTIYSRAKSKIYILDDYIDIRTLRLLSKARKNVEIIIFSDNVCHYLHESDYEDFKLEYPDKNIKFIKTCGTLHDRFIVIDYKTKDEMIYHSGASSKDAGKSITTIMELKTELTRKSMDAIVDMLMCNPELKLK